MNVITSDAPMGETNKRCPDISKLISLGFNPKFNLNDGLSKTVPWYFKNFELKP